MNHIDRQLAVKKKIIKFNETEPNYKCKNSSHMKNSVHGSKKDDTGNLPNSICSDEKGGKSISNSYR